MLYATWSMQLWSAINSNLQASNNLFKQIHIEIAQYKIKRTAWEQCMPHYHSFHFARTKQRATNTAFLAYENFEALINRVNSCASCMHHFFLNSQRLTHSIAWSPQVTAATEQTYSAELISRERTHFTHMHTYIHAYIHTCIPECTQTHERTGTHAHTDTRTDTEKHIHTRTHTLKTHTQTQTHKRTQTHTQR